MNKLLVILFGLLTLSGQSFGQFGHAVISKQPVYEEENNYFPHDYFVEEDMGRLLDTAVSMLVKDQQVLIENAFNDGFTGHKIQFLVSSDLEIIDVQYREWSDVIDGSETNYSVQKAILSMSGNPFENVFVTAHYTLQIREDYIAGEILKNEGVKNTTTYTVFNGKFKIYSEQEEKNGRDWIIGQNEIKIGIKDSLGVYLLPDEFAKYKFGNDSLKTLLMQFEIERSEIKAENVTAVLVRMIIDNNGEAESKNITLNEAIKSTRMIEQLRENENLLTNWHPAIYKGRPVKSEVYLPIRIK